MLSRLNKNKKAQRTMKRNKLNIIHSNHSHLDEDFERVEEELKEIDSVHSND